METNYKKFYKGMIGLNVVSFLFLVILLFGLNHLGWVDDVPYFWAPVLIIILFVFVRLVHKPFICRDQKKFFEQFGNEELIWVTHLASKEDMALKINNRKLSPFGLKRTNSCWFKIQTFLRKFGWADHRYPVIWVSAGAVIKGSGTKQGNPGTYSMGVIFQVDKNKLKFPSGLFQSVYFGSLHMVIEEEIRLSGNEHFYELRGREWVRINPIARP